MAGVSIMCSGSNLTNPCLKSSEDVESCLGLFGCAVDSSLVLFVSVSIEG